MMKFCSFVMVALICCAVAVAAPKEGQKGGDKPKASPEEMFKKLDKNGDSVLTCDEFVGKVKDEKQKEGREKAFKAKDKDGDGKLTLDEFKAGPAPKKGGKKK